MLQGAIISRAWPKWKNRKPQQRKKRYRDKLKFENWKIKYPRNKIKQTNKRPCKNFTEGAQRGNEENRRNQWTLRLKTIEVTQPAQERQPFALNEVDPPVGWCKEEVEKHTCIKLHCPQSIFSLSELYSDREQL